MKANRYTIEIGKYGAYFYDNKEKKSLSLDEVLELLNLYNNK